MKAGMAVLAAGLGANPGVGDSDLVSAGHKQSRSASPRPPSLPPAESRGGPPPPSPSSPKLAALRRLLSSEASLAVAFSGGTDSTFLLKIAHDFLGPRAAGFIAVSPFVPPSELDAARAWCTAEGIALHEVPVAPLDTPAIASNPPDRCYHCKKAIFTAILAAAKALGFTTVCDGTNADDAFDYRPGARALRELDIRTPLAIADLSKADIRALSKAFGLPTWNRPAAACLATRIPYGETLTAEKLQTIARAEAILHAAGFPHVRVRLHNATLARIEVPPAP